MLTLATLSSFSTILGFIIIVLLSTQQFSLCILNSLIAQCKKRKQKSEYWVWEEFILCFLTIFVHGVSNDTEVNCCVFYKSYNLLLLKMVGKHDWENTCDQRVVNLLFVLVLRHWIFRITRHVVIYVRTVIHDHFISSVKLIVLKFAAKNGLAELITLPEERLFLELVSIIIFIDSLGRIQVIWDLIWSIFNIISKIKKVNGWILRRKNLVTCWRF